MKSMVHTDTQVKSYDASDIYEGYALAYEQVADLATMFTAMSNSHEKTIEYLEKVYNVPKSVFKDLRRLFNITNGMIDESMEFSKALEDQYRHEYDGDGNA